MTLRLFAVRCGSMLKAVRAHDPEEAAAFALSLFAVEREGAVDSPPLSPTIIVAEEGQQEQDNLIGEVRFSLERAGLPIPRHLGRKPPAAAARTTGRGFFGSFRA